MRRRAMSLVVLVTFSIWVSGCSVHKAVQRPVGDYGTAASSSDKTVRVREVLTKAGEKTEFGGDDLAFVLGDDVVSFDEDARLLTVRKADATFEERDGELVLIKAEGEVYESFRIVTETQQAVSFVVTANPAGQEIPLAEIDQLWVEKKSRSKAADIGLVVAIGVGVFVAFVAASFESPEYF